MIQYPLVFNYHSQATPGIQTPWETSNHEGTISPCAIPPEFGGPGQGHSPEDFLGLAIINCFVATFKVFAEKSKVDFKSLTARGRLTVDRDDTGNPWMSQMQIQVQVTAGSADPERLKRILAKTSDSCLVVRSVKTQVHFEWSVL